ncbi:MAG: hypothetical protein ACKVU2_03895 [Saprospiraceae bacterium]
MNTFRNIQYGIRFEEQSWGTSAVTRCRFDRVLNDGIFMAQGNMRVERGDFLNNGFRGASISSRREAWSRNTAFSITAILASAQNCKILGLGELRTLDSLERV